MGGARRERGIGEIRRALERKGSAQEVGGGGVVEVHNLATIHHLHYDVIRAKPDGSCSRPAETGPRFPGGKASG